MSKKNYKSKNYWLIKENAINESKKYSSRAEFCKGSYGAYKRSLKNGWLDEMTWLTKKNVCKDPVDTVYRYYFENENAVYVGRTIYLELRDHQHRTREKDTVYKFAKEFNAEIPKIEVLEEGLTVLQGAEREDYWEKYYRNKGFTIINKQPCGSLGHMCKKWSKEKCFEEGKKYKTRSEFQKNAPQAYHLSITNNWIDNMTWLPKIQNVPNKFWNDKNNIINEAKKYKTRGEFRNKSCGAYRAAINHGYINELTWLNKKKNVPNGYWQKKENVINEAKKYKTRGEFQKNNVGAYESARKNKWFDEMNWFEKPKERKPKGYWKNKENVINESKNFKTRSEFKFLSQRAYESARKNKWLDEMIWLNNDDGKHPKGYWKNEKNIMHEAKKYSNKEEFKEKNLTAFLMSYRYGLNEKMDWMVKQKQHKKGYWTYNHIEEEALKYNTKSEFFKGNQTAYRAALKMGIIDDFFGLNDYVQ